MFGLELVEIRSFTFKARLYSDGTVVGHWFFKDVEDGVQFRLGGSLHCAVVRGNRAWFGGVIDNGNDPSALGLVGSLEAHLKRALRPARTIET